MKFIRIKAVDWGTYLDRQLDLDTEWQIVTADIVGILVHEDEEMIVLTLQQFNDGGVRGVLSVPKVCILEREDLRAA